MLESSNVCDSTIGTLETQNAWGHWIFKNSCSEVIAAWLHYTQIYGGAWISTNGKQPQSTGMQQHFQRVEFRHLAPEYQAAWSFSANFISLRCPRTL